MDHYEMEQCVIEAKKGNHEALLDLMEQFKNFIYKTAHKYNIKNHDFYDLTQIGYITVINCVMKYRTGKNTFAGYLYSSIDNAFKYLYRQQAKINAELSLNEQASFDENEGKEVMETLESLIDIEGDCIHNESIKELRKVISKLHPDELELVIMVYYNRYSLKTYAEKKGIHYQTCVKRRNRILEKIKNHLKK
jgi:RNA polymerase sporulation-specific sigma factor